MIGGVKPFILKHWEASIKLDPSCLELIPVWVSLPDLDIRFWSSHMLAAMGSAIGRPILTDFHNINQSRLSYARVMIEISAKQDLLREITFRGPGNKVIQQELHYECLPNHCPVCLLCFDLVQEWIASNPAASICTPQGVSDFKEMANFQDYHGLPEFRNAVARFMGKVRGDRAKFEPDRIVMSGGATGAHELMAFCLADPGDAFLVPTPYYPGFDRDLKWRTGVQLLPIETSSSNNFRITRSALEEAFLKAEEAKIKVKGVLITNPSNPLGTILDKETLSLLLSFINQKQIHLVCDEIYSATVFSDHPYRFTSIAEMIDQNNMMQTCNLDLIHIVYSLSKDMGFPGFRVGIVYSYNDKVVSCARKMSSFGLVSSQTQHLIAFMLSDDEFVETYLSESKKRLARRYKLFTLGLSLVGISSLKSNGGLFVWMDLRHLLKEPTEEAELSLWRVIINEVKLNVSPGSSFHCSEAGWFRVCFANMDDETVEVALRRIRSFMLKGYASENKANEVKKKKKKCWQMDLQLRLSAKRLEDIMGSGQVMSPHSPLPISPLVRART